MSEDKVAAALDGIRERYKTSFVTLPANGWTHAHSADDVPRLLAALDEVLKLHVRQDRPVKWWKPCGEHAATTLKRHDYIREMEACPVCAYDEQWVCLHCQCPHDEWPCPTYGAISRALLGEDGDDA